MPKTSYKRKYKADGFLNPGASREEIECDYGVAPFDRVCREMEVKWGVERLPTLVSNKTARKFGAAMAQLNEAIEAVDAEKTAHKAQVCIRGLMAMDQEATEAGHQQASGEAWEYELDGFHFAVLKNADEWPRFRQDRPGVRCFSMREVAIALKAQFNSPLVDQVKQDFPGGQIVSINEKTDAYSSEKLLDDEIPF